MSSPTALRHSRMMSAIWRSCGPYRRPLHLSAEVGPVFPYGLGRTGCRIGPPDYVRFRAFASSRHAKAGGRFYRVFLQQLPQRPSILWPGTPSGENPRVMGAITIRLGMVSPRTEKGVKSELDMSVS